MSLSREYKTDSEKEVSGVPVEVGQNDDGSIPTFILARASKTNKAYQAALTKAAAPFQRQIQLKIDVSVQLEKAFMDVFCDTVLRGWSNVLMSDVTGNESDKGFADFSKQNATLLFKRLPDLYDYLQEQANSASLFLDATREESAKN
ncbi:tail chaperonin [Xanthomonas phage Pfeifenkraut]|uniref:Tail chaperonin n=1 Tax=Xanthomonas phage Pfeifenkraut TaxID=2939132 RepID=A0A9E7E1E1_9CAUD|nr:tail chaperonin [Xanthomonas phage Pfeifenkraut]URA06917.1 tail chaperonin [Xanthomonas phage Pfeifenkraut]